MKRKLITRIKQRLDEEEKGGHIDDHMTVRQKMGTMVTTQLPRSTSQILATLKRK